MFKKYIINFQLHRKSFLVLQKCLESNVNKINKRSDTGKSNTNTPYCNMFIYKVFNYLKTSNMTFLIAYFNLILFLNILLRFNLRFYFEVRSILKLNSNVLRI